LILADSVLLVDDNPVQVATRQLVLSQAGIQVQIATSAASALALVRAPAAGTRIGAIVTDHIMPEASGAEFVRMLRAIDTDVPVIVITGLAEAEEEYAGLRVTFRQKPFPPAELISLVKTALGE
jgi:CheY-like chemotaxis protein